VIHDLLERDIQRGEVIGERLIITTVAIQCLDKWYKDFMYDKRHCKEDFIPHGEEFKDGWNAYICTELIAF